MAKKKRIFLVEDVASSRKQYKDRLELEGYQVDVADSLSVALRMLDNMTYHVALVDIMLDGPTNTANRDGVKVINHINELNEGTLIIPLTGQDRKSFVRDTFKDLGVFDFIDKHEDINNKGWVFAIERIEAAISRSELDDAPDWPDVVTKVLFPEEEQTFVGSVLRLDSGIKFDILKRGLCAAIREFQPLVGKPGQGSAFQVTDSGDKVIGDFWSKSHGRAVQFQMYKAVRTGSQSVDAQELFVRSKGKLSISVVGLEGKDRNDFL